MTNPPSAEVLSARFKDLMNKLDELDQAQDAAVEKYRNMYFIELDRSFVNCELASLDVGFARHALRQEHLRRASVSENPTMIAELNCMKKKADTLTLQLAELDLNDGNISVPHI